MRRQKPNELKRLARQSPIREVAEIIARFNQECKSAGRLTAIRQDPDKTRKIICGSEAIKGNQDEISSRDE